MKKILSLLPLLFAALFAACGGNNNNNFDLGKLSAEDLQSLQIEGYESNMMMVSENIEDLSKKDVSLLGLATIAVAFETMNPDEKVALSLDNVVEIEGEDANASVLEEDIKGQDGEIYKFFAMVNDDGTLRCWLTPKKVIDLMVSELEKGGMWKESADKGKPSETEKNFVAFASLIGSPDFKPEKIDTHIVNYDGKKALILATHEPK